jgi:hypothetical protein
MVYALVQAAAGPRISDRHLPLRPVWMQDNGFHRSYVASLRAAGHPVTSLTTAAQLAADFWQPPTDLSCRRVKSWAASDTKSASC